MQVCDRQADVFFGTYPPDSARKLDMKKQTKQLEKKTITSRVKLIYYTQVLDSTLWTNTNPFVFMMYLLAKLMHSQIYLDDRA